MEPGLVPRFRGLSIVVVGDLVADEYVYGETDRVSREAPVLVVRHESTQTVPGAAANAAANVAALGATARPVGLVGEDESGRALVSRLEEAGADVAGIVASASRRTETKTRILAGGRSTTRQQMLRLDRADERPIDPAQRRQVRERLRRACEGADAVMACDYGGGLFDEPLVALLRDAAKRLPVLVDSRYDLARFRGTTLAKPNEPELETWSGGRLRTDDDVERAGRRLLDALDAKALVVTRGRRGLWLFEPHRPTEKLAVSGPEEAVDVTGAGDTVLATLACALAAKTSFREAAELANVAGGIVVQKPGTATCGVDELSRAVAAATPKRRDVPARAAARAARK